MSKQSGIKNKGNDVAKTQTLMRVTLSLGKVKKQVSLAANRTDTTGKAIQRREEPQEEKKI